VWMMLVTPLAWNKKSSRGAAPLRTAQFAVEPARSTVEGS
jgi:hypothetical protein